MTEQRYNPDQAYLANFVRDVRNNMGITQKEFAELAEIRHNAMQGTEAYFRNYTESTITLIASFTGVELAYLLMLRDLQELARLVSLMGISDEAKERFYTICDEIAANREGARDA